MSLENFKPENLFIGNGYDPHRLVARRRLILGGVEIPHKKGLLGHSDGDVLTHAICDALLGAKTLGDLGTFFPNTEEFEDISSLKLLGKVWERVMEPGLSVVFLDSTMILQEPQLRPYVKQIRENIASLLRCPLDRVSVKATTTDGVGKIGEGKAAAALATVYMYKYE